MDSLLQDLVTAQAEHHWVDAAIISGASKLTYGEIETKSDQLANLLRASGCGRGDRVALLSPPSPAAVVAMLGTYKADCIYVPLDCSRPAADLSWIVQACQPQVLLTAESTASLLNDVLARDPRQLPRTVGSLEAHALETASFRTAFCFAEIEGLPARRLAYRNWPADAAYVQFLPCATGVPKPAVVSHDRWRDFIVRATRHFGVQPGDRHAAYVPLTSDLSIYGALGTLAAGATLYVAPVPGAARPEDLAAFIRSHELTQWCAAQETLAWMAEANVVARQDFPSLKRVIWSGEAAPARDFRHWVSRLPHTRFHGLYEFLPSGAPSESDARRSAADESDSSASATRPRVHG